ncbi:MAG: LPS export ABC transporter permease LptF [Candidatus Manganitrophus sp.]|nr:MAG: LPS export ABC transporter permease LptF [Candidatus Manganitrophus sp.]
MIRILDRYILKELLIPFFFGIFILTFLILIHQLLRLMELVIDKGVDLLSVGQIFLTLLPSFFLLTIPMAVLMSSVMTFNRLSNDNEITALKSSGVGFYRYLRPVLFFSVAAALVTLFMGMIAQPWGGGSFKSLAMKILKKRASVGIEEGKFNGTFSDIMIYVESMPTFTEMEGVFIYDVRDQNAPKIIVAKKGILLNDPGTGAIEFHLLNGSLHAQRKEGADYQHVVFATYDLRLDLGSVLQGGNTNLETPTYQEIKENVEASGGKDLRALRLLSEFYKNFSFSLASLVFGLVGVPLGIISGRTGRLGGFTVGIGLITLYYLLNTLGDYLITIRFATPFLAVWVPHLALIPLTLYLMRAMARESYPKFLQLGNKRP